MLAQDATCLNYLAVKSMAPAEAVARAVGCEEAEAQELLAGLSDQGLVEERRLGFRLTEAGSEAVAKLRATELADGTRERLDATYAGFEELNPRLLQLATDWQVISIGGEQSPNDHTDDAYDAAVLDRLYALHGDFGTVLGDIEDALPRLGSYRPRFDAAIERIEAGDHDYVTRPDRDAYHTLWFELHEELLQLLGRERES